VVYPDSAPENWTQLLEDSLGMWLISPLHEPDPEEDQESGAIKTKKPHYHVMYFHGSPISCEYARNIFAEFPFLIMPPGDRYFSVGSVRNLTRYFVHLDQPEKQQWAEKPFELLTALNGFPLDLERELTRADKRELKKSILAYVQDNNVMEYSELIDALMHEGAWEMFDYATDHCTMFQHYLMSVRKKLEKQ